MSADPRVRLSRRRKFQCCKLGFGRDARRDIALLGFYPQIPEQPQIGAEVTAAVGDLEQDLIASLLQVDADEVLQRVGAVVFGIRDDECAVDPESGAVVGAEREQG